MSYRKNSLLFSDGVASVFSTTSDYLNNRRTYRQTLRYFPLNVAGKSGKTSRATGQLSFLPWMSDLPL